MRIAQIVDSLEIGGAEKMAVNYANALAYKVEFSGLIVTRKEGNLKAQVDEKVSYLYLEKRKTFDLNAIFKLRLYCKKNRIDVLHAHSTSYFLAVLVKFLVPRIKIIWHDHNGLSEFVYSKNWYILKVASFSFNGIVSVNETLKLWAIDCLFCKNVIYLPNFTNKTDTQNKVTFLKGIDHKRIISLANLREQKNHLFLIEVVKIVIKTFPDWTFHLVGKDFEDEYSSVVKKSITSNFLANNVFFYGSRTDTDCIIDQATIGIITSKSEGLPVVLLEYGLHGKPVVVTNVGEIPTVVKNGKNGIVVESENIEEFSSALVSLMQSDSLRAKLGKALRNTINNEYSQIKVLNLYYDFVRTIL